MNQLMTLHTDDPTTDPSLDFVNEYKGHKIYFYGGDCHSYYLIHKPFQTFPSEERAKSFIDWLRK